MRTCVRVRVYLPSTPEVEVADVAESSVSDEYSLVVDAGAEVVEAESSPEAGAIFPDSLSVPRDATHPIIPPPPCS